jgi:hypothetical protein
MLQVLLQWRLAAVPCVLLSPLLGRMLLWLRLLRMELSCCCG